jgi:hypothetical protein
LNIEAKQSPSHNMHPSTTQAEYRIGHPFIPKSEEVLSGLGQIRRFDILYIVEFSLRRIMN